MRDLVLTDAARKLRDSAGVTDEQVRSLGKRLIREADIAALVGACLLPVHRREVTDAFVAVKVRCDELSTLDVAAILDELKPRFPMFFSALDEQGRPVSPAEDSLLTVSVNADPDVIFAVPVIRPPQVCVVSIGSVQCELVLDDGQVRESRYVTAGLTYDHRVIDGPCAVEFLTAFKSTVEKPAEARL
jgi:hypothetical protein